jgi:hypothetical protein
MNRRRFGGFCVHKLSTLKSDQPDLLASNRTRSFKKHQVKHTY